MPIPLIAAGIAAAGAVAGGAISSSATKKAAQASQDSTTQQINASNANRDYQYNLNAPAIQGGSAADARIQALLGLGGDAASAEAGFDAFRESGGYDFRLGQGTSAINSNAYAKGMGNSGATWKALMRYGQDYGSNERNVYLGQLGGVSGTGAQARGLVAGVGNNATNMQAQALAANGQNQGQAAIAQGANMSGVLQNLAQIGGSALQSSYQPQNNVMQGPGGYQTPGYGGLPSLGSPAPSFIPSSWNYRS